MRNYKLKTVVSVLLLFAGILLTGSQAFAIKFSYGECGNGIWERNPFRNIPVFSEQCDNGPDNGKPGNGCTKDCWIKQVMVGNGVIERYERNGIFPWKNYYEECDDGNNVSGDGCSAQGRIEKSVPFTVGVCGNGIKESTEMCDDGKTGRNCKADCSGLKGNLKDSDCREVPVCGNGVVDKVTGEQCDDRGESETCSSVCTLKTQPHFTAQSILFFPLNGADGIMDGNLGFKNIVTSSKQVGSAPIDPKIGYVDDQGNRINAFKISHRGQVISVKESNGKQYSGVVLSGQKIDFANHPDQVFTARFVISAYNDKVFWDDDAIGLVFGMDKNDITNPNANYLMLSWRSAQRFAGDYTNIQPSRCDQPVYAGMRGLQLYQIKGVPDYNELWQMKDCAGSGAISRLKTEYMVTDGPEYYWSRMVNPAYLFDTPYSRELNMTTQNPFQKLQILAEYSAKGLKVWVNYQKALDIDASVLGDKWPSTGEWGFYFLGMDNFIADFRGYEQQISLANFDDNDPFASDTDTPKSMHCPVCGDGYVDIGEDEECDDGGTQNGDGCNSNCKLEDDPKWVCRTTDNHTVCFTGGIVSPRNGETIGSSQPTIIGTYEGGPEYIHVSVTDKQETEVCSGKATFTKKTGWQGSNKLLNGEWKFSTKDHKCTLTDGNYKITATIKANENSTKELEITSSFTVNDDYPTLTIDAPEGNPAATQNTTIEVSGTVEDASKVAVNVTGGNCKEPTITDNKYKSTCTLNSPGIGNNSTHEISVTATNANGSTTESKTIIFDLGKPEPPIFDEPTSNSTVSANPDATITVQGQVPDEDRGDGKSPSKVQVTVTPMGGGKGVVTDVPVDRNGNFKGKVALPEGGGPYKIVGVTIDDAGNISDETKVTDVNVTGIPSPVVIVTQPSEGEVIGIDKLRELEGTSSTGGLPVEGTSTPGGYYKITEAKYCIITPKHPADPNDPDKCVSTPVNLPKPIRDESTGDWSTTIPTDDIRQRGGEVTYKIILTTKVGDNTLEEHVSHFTIDQRRLDDTDANTPEFVSPKQTKGGEPGQPGTGDAVTAEGKYNTIDVKLEIPASPERKVKAGDTAVVIIKDKNGKEKEVIGEWEDGPDGSLLFNEPNVSLDGMSNGKMTFTGYAVTPGGNKSKKQVITVDVDGISTDNSQGFVAGGCASVPGNPANDNLPILLLIGLGVVAIRRSRK